MSGFGSIISDPLAWESDVGHGDWGAYNTCVIHGRFQLSCDLEPVFIVYYHPPIYLSTLLLALSKGLDVAF